MNPDIPILTIAIPTYNRAAKLQAQLERLVPQLTPEVRLCIYDNASLDNTQAVVANFVSRGVSCFQATINYGAHRNFFRAFEECQTEWLWILSDDDLVTETAVADLLANLNHPSADFIHINSGYRPHTQEKLVPDVVSMFEYANVANLLWITGGIYRINSFRPQFRLYTDASFTCGPHLVMLLSLLESRGGKVLLAPVSLTNPKLFSPSWSTLDVLFRISVLPEFMVSTENQRLVAECLFLEFFNVFMLMGLRETSGKTQVQKWQRVYAQTRKLLRSYRACEWEVMYSKTGINRAVARLH